MSYPDFLQDRDGLNRWRESAGTGDGHQMVANNNTVFRFVQTIDRLEAVLRASAASPESGPLGLKMQSNPSSLSDIKRLREALEFYRDNWTSHRETMITPNGPKVQRWKETTRALEKDGGRRASEALSSVVGEGNQEISSSVAESGGTASPKSDNHNHPEGEDR